MKSISESISKSNTTCNCNDPIECLRHMFVDMVQKERVKKGQCPARRPVFLCTHGIIKGTIEIEKNIPDSYKQGIFSHSGSHPTYIRYSSDLSDGRPDWMSTIGIGIKIFDIPGKKIISDDGHNSADLILQNVPNFFVDTAKDMCGFTKASLEGWGDEWIQENSPITSQLLEDMAKPIRSVFETSLWSVVPFRLGKDNYCKYILRPGESTFPGEPNIEDPNFLAKDLIGRLALGDASLEIYIQKRPDKKEYSETDLEKTFPLDKGTVIWDEKKAIPVKVATIKLPKQDIQKKEQEIYGDWLSFNIGRVPKENGPVGSIAEARMSVYQTSADYRRETNNQPTKEPTAPGEPKVKNPECPFPGHEPQEAPKALSKTEIDRITHVKIHPGIGVSRVGNSQSGYYIGPETKNPNLTSFGETRDPSGAVKRQAARFRVYGYDKNGDVVAEIQQSKNSSIEWSVHIANKKAAWYEFDAALDIPATVNLKVPLRNPDVTGSGRKALCIDPGQKKISGIGMTDSSFQMIGEFQGTEVTLGELKTDMVGRLLVLPGHGISASPSGKPVFDPGKPSSFNNAAGWYDDIADGPVHAKVTVGEKDFNADGAWVVSAPPNFAPNLVGWRTLNDLMRDVFIKAGMEDLPTSVSFSKHVLPILERLTEMQWVNKGFSSMFGAGSPMDFQNSEIIRKISQAPTSSQYPDPFQELRRTIYNSFRATNTRSVEEGAWPWVYGDAFGYTDPDPSAPPSPKKYLSLPFLYDYILSKWVDGTFINDYDPGKQKKKQTIDEFPLQQQPSQLDEAAMHFCLADAFHPGCELTWPMRHTSMYRAPYRIREREAGSAEQNYGSTLSTSDVAKMSGPLFEQGPGELTRWMAIPWQGDTAYCRSGYDMEYDPYLPTFWPARVPNQVLTEIDYNTLCDTSLSMEERIAAFHNRPSWLRQLPAHQPAPVQMMYMINHFGEMGILEARPKPGDIDWLPDVLYVENLAEIKRKELEEAHKLFQADFGQLGAWDRLIREAGWFSEEQRNEFISIKRRNR